MHVPLKNQQQSLHAEVLTVLIVSRPLLGGEGVTCRLERTNVAEGIVTKALGEERILRTKLREAYSVNIYMMKHDSGGDEVVVESAERESITGKIPRGPRDFLASRNSTNQIKICL